MKRTIAAVLAGLCLATGATASAGTATATTPTKVVVIYISHGHVTPKPTRFVEIARVMAIKQTGQITVTVYYN